MESKDILWRPVCVIGEKGESISLSALPPFLHLFYYFPWISWLHFLSFHLLDFCLIFQLFPQHFPRARHGLPLSWGFDISREIGRQLRATGRNGHTHATARYFSTSHSLTRTLILMPDNVFLSFFTSPTHLFAGLLNTDLSIEERNMFSIACKNSASTRRASLRILASIENKEEKKGEEDKWRLEVIRWEEREER